MDFTHYSDRCMQAAGDLVNTRGHPSGTEYMGTVEQAIEFLRERDFSAIDGLSRADLAELHLVRDRLEKVFYAPDERTAVALVNELMDDYAVKPHLTDHDGRWHFHYAPAGTPLGHRVAADIVMGLGVMIAEYGFERFGICAAHNCEDVFIDISKNKSRRYCTDSCSSRANVAAYRARAKATAS